MERVLRKYCTYHNLYDCYYFAHKMDYIFVISTGEDNKQRVFCRNTQTLFNTPEELELFLKDCTNEKSRRFL